MSTIPWTRKIKTALITGKNTFLKQRELDRAIKAYSDHRLYDFNAGTQMDEALQALNGRSLFSEKKLVVIHSIGLSKSKIKVVKDYCANPAPDVVLVMMSQDKKRLLKAVSDLKPDVQANYDDLPSWDVPKWVAAEAKARGLTFPSSFANAIVMNVGEDLYSLTNELDKLEIYCDGNTEVQVADIEAVLFQHTSFSPFDVIQLWGVGEQDQAVRLFLTHLDQTPQTEWMRSVLVILGGLQDRVENLLKAKDLKARGQSSNNIAQKIGVSPYIYTNNVVPQMTARKAVSLEDAYIDLCKIEARVKMGGPGKLLLESFFLNH